MEKTRLESHGPKVRERCLTTSSLTELDRGDPAFNVDFRSINATVLDKWLSAPSEKVLGKRFPLLQVV